MPADFQQHEETCARSGTSLPHRATSRPSSQGDAPPTQYPCRTWDDVLAQFRAALAAAPPAALLDDLPELHPDVRELVLDRIEAALYERRVSIDCDTYSALLMALMPAEFDIPDAPAKSTPTAPKTRDRELVYAARCRRAVILFHAEDANGRPDIVLDTAWGDGRAPRVKGWREERALRADTNRQQFGTVPGAKKKKKKKLAK